MSALTVAEAYRECERITCEQARNFSWGIRLLPPPKRAALSAVYAMARRIDDIGDGTLPAQDKLRLLAEARVAISGPQRHQRLPEDPVLIALADAAEQLPIPMAAFGELIDGCEMDVRGHTYHDLEELLTYCRNVAGSIGRLSVGVFGSAARPRTGSEPATDDLADALGIALQMTNILRDIREDYLNGRVYLPSKDLDLFGVQIVIGPDGRLDPCDGALAELIRFEAARAWGFYDRGLQLLARLDRRSAACCAAMAGIYLELLERIAADPSQVMSARMSLPATVKLRVAVGALARSGGGGHGR